MARTKDVGEILPIGITLDLLGTVIERGSKNSVAQKCLKEQFPTVSPYNLVHLMCVKDSQGCEYRRLGKGINNFLARLLYKKDLELTFSVARGHDPIVLRLPKQRKKKYRVGSADDVSLRGSDDVERVDSSKEGNIDLRFGDDPSGKVVVEHSRVDTVPVGAVLSSLLDHDARFANSNTASEANRALPGSLGTDVILTLETTSGGIQHVVVPRTHVTVTSVSCISPLGSGCLV
jgi:hypothetical protein